MPEVMREATSTFWNTAIDAWVAQVNTAFWWQEQAEKWLSQALESYRLAREEGRKVWADVVAQSRQNVEQFAKLAEDYSPRLG